MTSGGASATSGSLSVTVHGSGLRAALDQARQAAAGDDLARRLSAKDADLWGPDARSEAAIRLGWLDLPASSRELLPRIADLKQALSDEGVDRVVLAGMGGSSLAPEVITRTAGVPLIVLDTTDPGQVRTAMVELDRTVVVLSSKSGTTIETASQHRAFRQAFLDAGLSAEEAARRFVAVTDPGSPLERIGRSEGFREVFLADPNVGGRYSALSAFGLVPSGLAGADVERLLDEAAELRENLDRSTNNAALDLGAALGGAGVNGRDKVVLVDDGGGLVGFGDWAEQLIAESTGKQGVGLLPVVVGPVGSPGTEERPDSHLVLLGGSAEAGSDVGEHTGVSGSLGAQFLGWEYATAVAGRVLGINPFDQPNVTESKQNTARILADGLPEAKPAFVDGAVEVYGDETLLGSARDVGAAVAALLDAIPDRGYLAVMAYLDRIADADAAEIRGALARRQPHPVTFGWGPRFLHSTGQYHKGGPQNGVFLQVTGAVAADLDVPGEAYTFGQLQAAQWAGDLQALQSRGRPALRLHLTDRAAGISQLRKAT